MATIQQRKDEQGNIRYRVQIRLKGHPASTATFTRKTDAKLWAQHTEAAIRDGRHFNTSEAKRHTFGEMIDRYVRSVLPSKGRNSQHAQQGQLLWWRERLGKRVLADVTPALIAEQRDVLADGITSRGTKRSSSTVVRYMAALSHCYTIAMKEWGWVDDNPMRKVTKPKEPRGRVRFLSDDERARLLDTCRKSKNEYLYDVVVLAISTGMRHSEVMNLKWDDVDTHRSVAILHKTKNNERRAVPITGHALELMRRREQNQRHDNPYIFPGPYRRGREPRPISIRSAWDRAVKEAGIEDFKFHDLRHSAASYSAMNGASLVEIADVLGHKTLQMVKRYSHLSEAHTSKIVERMNTQIFAPVDSDNIDIQGSGAKRVQQETS